MTSRIPAALILALTLSSAALAGPELDRVLDYAFMDFSTRFKNRAQQFDNQREIQIMREQCVGQTFRTGPKTGVIYRIRSYVPPTSDWQPGEGAEMTLWDSPAKRAKLASAVNWYENRTWHYHQMEWDLNVPAKPNTSYYFEITYAGDGDGKIGRVGVMNGADGCPHGQGYLNGREADFDVCFQIHSRRPPDPIANLKRMFSRINLDYPGLEQVKAAVSKGDLETAIARTVAYFESRPGPGRLIREGDVPSPKPSEFIARADALMNATWRDVDFEGFEGKKIFGHAYMSTGDHKYAKKLNDLMIDWMAGSPPPSESRIGGCPWDGHGWASLSTGLRVGHGFVAYSLIHTSPAFTTDCRMAYIISLADHCNTLVMTGADSHGNWSFTQNSSMLTFAMNFPEFRESEVWKQTAIDRLASTIAADWLPDGAEMESAFSYQRMAYNPLARSVYDDLIVKRGLKTPFSGYLRDILEKQAEYFMYAPMPNGVTPMFGDWAHDQMRGAIGEDAERFARKDMLYVSTAGQQGRRPKEISKLYPCSGVVTMRSDWGGSAGPYENARYAMVHGVHFGAHGHEDINAIIGLYAYGRELLTDPGSHEYGSPQHNLLVSSVSHNLLTVDGGKQDRNADTAFENWSTTPIADYLSSRIGNYTRELFYVRTNGDANARDYWVVRDCVSGSGKRSLEQRWHFMLDSNVGVEQATLQARTRYPDKGNLAIMQVSPERLRAEETTIDSWQDRADTDKPPSKMPTVIYTANAELPAAIDTVLFPFDGKDMPPVNLAKIEAGENGLDSAFKIVQGSIEDLFVLRTAAGKWSLASERVGSDAERVFIRRVNGELRSVLLVNGTGLSVGDQEVVRLAKPYSWIAVTFDEKRVRIYTSEGGLRFPMYSEDGPLQIGASAAKGTIVTVENTATDELIDPAQCGKPDRNPLLNRVK